MERYFNQIMILDDDEPTTYLAKYELEEQNCCNSIITFYHSKKALEFIENTIQKGEQLPDVIFTDLNLPRMNGWEFLEALRKTLIETSVNIPIVYILSTSLNPEDSRRASETEFVAGFLQKPLDREKIQQIINVNNLKKNKGKYNSNPIL